MVDTLNAGGVQGKGVMAVSRKKFYTSAILLVKVISISDGLLRTVSVMSARLAS